MSTDLAYQPKEQIRQYQEKALRNLLQYLQQRSPFYSRLFKKEGIKDIQHLEDLSLLPVTTKADLQQYNEDFWCVSKAEIADYSTTSGTTGKPVVIPQTQSDIARLARNESLALATAGCGAGDVIQLTTTMDKMFMAGLAYFQGAQALGATTVRVGTGSPRLQWDMIFKLKPTVLIIVPSFLAKLVDYAREHHLPYEGSSVQKAICIGEPIRNPDFSLNALGKKIHTAWPLDMYGTYASSEMQTAFTECSEHQGGHLIPELLIVELLDENNRAVRSGQPGNVTITTLGVEAMPLLRFQTGDIACFHESPCACGRNTLRIGPVIGRKDQMLKLKGTTLFPAAVANALDEMEGIDRYVVEITKDAYGNDQLSVYVHTAQYTKETVQERLKSLLRVTPHVVLAEKDTISAMQKKQGIRKEHKVLDNR